MSDRKLIKSTGIIGSATAASRVLGFVRDILFARIFGTGMAAQAFIVAFRIPNMLRDMIGEGATNAAIVPILSEYQHTRTREEYWEGARVIFNLMVMALGVITVCGIVFAPVIVRIVAPGFLQDTEKFLLTVSLTRMVFPYIFLLGLVAYSKGVLNSLNFFVTPAIAPVVLNITMILSLYFLCRTMGVRGLVFGVISGGIFQVLLQIPPLAARGFRLGLGKGFNLAHPLAKRIGKLLLPRAVGSAVYQLSVLVDTVLASLAWIVGAGGVAALHFATRLVHLPLAIFGIALATAVLPRMSREMAHGNTDKLKHTVLFSLKTVWAVMIPSAVGLAMLADPIVRTIFQGGRFTAYSTGITSGALFYYALGLFAYAGIKILVNTYYSMGDTRTPVKTAAVSLTINIVLNLILMWPLKIAGLALATAIAASVNFVMLYILLAKRIGDVGTKTLMASFARVGGASAVMAVFILFAGRTLLRPQGIGDERNILGLVITVLVGICVYFIAAYIVKVESVRRLWAFVVSKTR